MHVLDYRDDMSVKPRSEISGVPKQLIGCCFQRENEAVFPPGKRAAFTASALGLLDELASIPFNVLAAL
ncbi:hypothetical protein [Agrobacterium pusense]|uniref:hypothetical protein n=1 Tax=Agrobacterium pusense TaxID=648995 RepID=UPI00289FCFD7|nr:hypothetical protein [Agrobacterium pusense]